MVFETRKAATCRLFGWAILLPLSAAIAVSATEAIASGNDRPAAARQLSIGEIQILQTIHNRQNFMNRQQMLREIDRSYLSAPQPRQEVPVFRGSCISPTCR